MPSVPRVDHRPTSAVAIGAVVLLCLALLLTGVVVANPSTTEASAERTLSSTVVAPGGTVEVTVSASVEEAQNLVVTETFDPAAGSIEIVDDDGADEVTVDNDSLIEATFTDRESVEFTYRYTAAETLSTDDTISFDGTVTGDVSLQTGTDTVTVTDDPGVAIVGINVPDEVVAGEPVTIETTLEHLGSGNETTTLTLTDGNETIAEETVTLEGFEQRTMTHNWTPDPASAGALVLTASTDTHEYETPVTVLKPATFELADMNAPMLLTQFDPFTATVTVENTGDITGSQLVTLELSDGTVLDETAVSLDGNSSATVAFNDVVIERSGSYHLIVRTDDDELTRQVVVQPAEANVELEAQLLGTDGSGGDAVFVTDLVAGEGWAVAVLDDEGTVRGTVTVEEAIEGETLVIPMADGPVGGGIYEAVVVPDADAVTLGESVPDHVAVLASDDGLVIEGGLTVPAVTYHDGTTVLHIRAANLDGGDAVDSISYRLGVYADAGTVREQLLGTSPTLSGAADRIAIELDDPIETPGTYTLAVKVHQLGTSNEPFRHASGASVEPAGAELSVTVLETATFEIDSVDAPSTAAAGTDLAVDVTIRNTGSVEGTQTVWMAAGNHVGLEELTLAVNETQTVTIAVPLTSADLGELRATIEVGNSREDVTLTVEEADVAGPPRTNPVPGLSMALAAVGGLALAVALWVRVRPRRDG